MLSHFFFPLFYSLKNKKKKKMKHGFEVFTMVHFKQMFHSIKVLKIIVKEHDQWYTFMYVHATFGYQT